ncbi:type II toxin-antitoxin system BrnA family antitoxin [Agrobacterium tumefaciens]|uniref:type II toxin-antitoxin system BrnA family antitoxin n=1 Tax=Agrobacterium tumefaciens TaxID=358 RepID=UPI000FAF4086|nr:CopG family transcriptional regulator [Agrobacterium tumefaciens]
MKTISAEEFDRKFDQGEDIDEYLDWSTARHAGLDLVRVDINLPENVLRKLDGEATRLGTTRQSLVAKWIVEMLENSHSGK